MNIFKTKNNLIDYTITKSVGFDYSISINNGELVLNSPWGFSKGTVSILGAIHQFRLYYKHVKSSTINLINRTIEIILPNKYKKLEVNEILKILVEKIYDKIAEREIEQAMERTRLLLGFAPEDYEVKRLENGQMGMCITEEQKIIISPDIVKYDRKTIDYIVLHEFCHLKYKTHCKSFWQMMKTYMSDYKEYEKAIA